MPVRPPQVRRLRTSGGFGESQGVAVRHDAGASSRRVVFGLAAPVELM